MPTLTKLDDTISCEKYYKDRRTGIPLQNQAISNFPLILIDVPEGYNTYLKNDYQIINTKKKKKKKLPPYDPKKINSKPKSYSTLFKQRTIKSLIFKIII